MPRIYLAGPGVFLRDAVAHGARLKAICAAHGAAGLYPLDAAPPNTGDLPAAIRLANLAMIRGADALVADMRPHRGIGMDGGTAYEMGYAAALGLPVVGYAQAAASYVERASAAGGLTHDACGVWDEAGLQVEEFGRPLADNLMMACGLDGVAADADRAIALAVALLRARGVA